jgi:hypothetical protein
VHARHRHRRERPAEGVDEDRDGFGLGLVVGGGATGCNGGLMQPRLLVLHDDADREFAYTSGAEKALAEANERGWTVMSMKHDFATAFAEGV